MRHPATRRRAGALAFALTLGWSGLASADATESPTGDRGADMAADLVLVRPLGLIGAVLGTVGFVVALPFTLPSGSAGDTAKAWIGAPLEYTFNRPLGEFHVCGEERRPCGTGTPR